jgi:glycosyltransferase involved in cell wall biosynthesis
MKILHVLYSGLGGHGNVFFSMIKADVNKQIEYQALFYGIEDIKNEYIEQCEENEIKYFFAKKKRGLDIPYYWLILKYIKRSKADIVFLHGSAYILPAKIASFFSKKKYRIVIRETQANHLKTKAQWITLCFAMLLADKIVCLTKEFNSQIRKKIKYLYKNEKVIVIPNGIDLEVFKPKEGKLHTNEFNIGMQSRIIDIKDHITLLKAFAIVKKSEGAKGKILTLTIAGDGELKEELIRLSETLAIKDVVIFTGMLHEKDLIDFLQTLDLYVHASLGETMSTAIMQAMACRLPIIASDVDGINNMITESSTGILVQVKNELLLAEAIIDCIKNPVKTNSLAESAYQYALNNFSNQTMFAEYKKSVFMS